VSECVSGSVSEYVDNIVSEWAGGYE